MSHPLLPRAFTLPLKIIPARFHSTALVAVLNRIFSRDLADGELDFMQDRVLQICVEDTGIEYRFTVDDERFTSCDSNLPADLVLKGTVYDYLLLASRREDTDTLFFNRRLRLEGDTELGLFVKNFLDGLDMDTHRVPGYLETVLQKSLPVYERLFG
jgi:O2-independent ubiquinone biosynthesis accessory factor UbiT